MAPRARTQAGILLAVIVALAIGYLTARPLPPPTPNLPGTFSFAVLGDAPYYGWEDVQYRFVLRALDAHDLSWVLHVGDMFWRPCTDALYNRSLGWFNGLRHPVIYTPGDNEWRDCWEPGSGGFAPRGRLDRIRQIFFADPTRSLGGKTLSTVSQANREPFPEFVENLRWTHQGIAFATVHLVGNLGSSSPSAERAAAAVEMKRRTDAAAHWLRETFAEARTANASAVVVGFHGNPFLEEPVDEAERQAFEPFLAALEEEAAQFARPVLAAHGDDHTYTVDHPLVRRSTGQRLENFTRLEVPGSPEVGWVRVVVTPGPPQTRFSFEEHVVPRWKYW